MQKQHLAQALRQRQYAYGVMPRQVIDSLPDEATIASYITCPECGEQQVEGSQLDLVISRAQSANHFFALCDQLAGQHQEQQGFANVRVRSRHGGYLN